MMTFDERSKTSAQEISCKSYVIKMHIKVLIVNMKAEWGESSFKVTL